MTVIGVELEQHELVLTKGRDFRWVFTNVDDDGNTVNFPSGTLVFEFDSDPVRKWYFTISGAVASMKIESDQVDLIKHRTRWQLVFYPAGELVGGDPLAIGAVRVQK